MMFATTLMFLVLVLLVVIGVAGTIVIASGHAAEPVAPESGRPTPSGARPANRMARPHERRVVDPRLGIQLDHWVAAGLLSPDQADAIAAHERRRAPAPVPEHGMGTVPAAVTTRRRIPLVAEGLGYIGGILGTVGLVLLVSRYWEDLATGARLGLTGATAIGLVVAGWVVHETADPSLARLRWTLWLASTVATGLFAFVLADQALGLDRDERVAIMIAAAVALESGVLWWNRPRPIQQLTTLGGLSLTTGLLVGELAGDLITGAAVWLVGAVMLVLGLRHLTTLPIVTLVPGAITTVAGTIAIASARGGIGLPLLCLNAAALIGLAVAPSVVREIGERIVLVAIGVLGLLQGLPPTIVWFADQAAVATGLVVWGIGAALLALAARRRIRAAIAFEVVGGLAMIGGAAVTGVQSVGFATVFGIITAIGFVMLGMLPGRVLMSLFGSVGLLVFVPWTIAHYFPGEDRAPLLILVSGALLVAIAVLLSRQGKRFRRELTGPTESRPASDARRVDIDAEEHPSERLVQPR